MDIINTAEIPVIELIPQRPPFVMIDLVKSCVRMEAVTELTVRRDNVFFEENGLSQFGIIENMAQSCAARMGYINMLGKESVKIGFIGDIKKCVILRTPLEGEVLTTTVHVIEDVLNFTLVDVDTKVGDELIATAQMKIATIDETAG